MGVIITMSISFTSQFLGNGQNSQIVHSRSRGIVDFVYLVRSDTRKLIKVDRIVACDFLVGKLFSGITIMI